MLEILIVFAFFNWILSLIRKPYEEKIRTAASVEEAVALRRKLKRKSLRVSIVLVAIYMFFCLYSFDGGFDLMGLRAVALVGVYLIQARGFRKLHGNFSILRKDEFLQANPSFILYLRGFEDDNYKVNTFRKRSWKSFSEDEFVSALRGVLPCCAIGMTKEITAPVGAQRIYVSDQTWQNDVCQLLNMATYIVILVNDRPSCLWEIEQCQNILYKAFFIIEDLDRYATVRDKFRGKIDFPDVPYDVNVPFCVRCKSLTVVPPSRPMTIMTIIQFANSRKGYEVLLEQILDIQTNERRKKRNPNKKALRVLTLIAWIIFGCLLVSVNLGIGAYIAKNENSLPLYITIIIAIGILLSIVEAFVISYILRHFKRKDP